MNVFTVLFCILPCLFHSYSANDDLESKLKNYEIVEDIAVHTISERSTDEVTLEANRKSVRFKGLGRKFSLHLSPVNGLFSPNFKAEVVNKEGKRESFILNKKNFYMGKVDGDDKSEVHAYFDDDDTLTASISTEGDDIMIEPEWRHTKKRMGSSSDNKRMVMYKAEDVKWPAEMYNTNTNQTGPQFCGAFHADKDHGFDEIKFTPHDEDLHHHHISKRAAKVNCRMIAVADYKFYSGMGGSDIYRTANYIVGVIQKANLIFRGTNFGVGSGFGFEIAQMIVHESYTSVVGGARHYNMDASWRDDARGLLDTFSAYPEEWSQFCVAHLFTHQPFDDNVLGLAYIAGSRSSDVGGICSPATYLNGVGISPNTGWTSTTYTSGRTVLNRQAELVTAHELGHNWGSPHDDTGSSSCAPNSIIGDGKYLMYPYSVTGEDPNNDNFSPCSRNWIKSVLEVKQSSCFSESTSDNLCGNGRIDYGNNEECDAGPLGSFNLDPCCDGQCRLKGGAVCSPYNFGCCSKSCGVAQANVQCNSGETCKNVSVCDGQNIGCPAAQNAQRGTPCSGGFCENGVCAPTCEFYGKFSCACQEISLSCRRCCRDTPDGACVPYGVNLFLTNGQTCPQGYCSDGTCIEANPGYVTKLFEFLENLSFDAIAEMFRTNMVAFTQLFSLLLFIPICIIVYCIDRKNTKKVRLQEAAEIRYDRTLTMDEDRREIRRKLKMIPRMIPAGSVTSSQLPPLRGSRPRPGSTSSRSNRVTPLPRRY